MALHCALSARTNATTLQRWYCMRNAGEIYGEMAGHGGARVTVAAGYGTSRASEETSCRLRACAAADASAITERLYSSCAPRASRHAPAARAGAACRAAERTGSYSTCWLAKRPPLLPELRGGRSGVPSREPSPSGEFESSDAAHGHRKLRREARTGNEPARRARAAYPRCCDASARRGLSSPLACAAPSPSLSCRGRCWTP